MNKFRHLKKLAFIALAIFSTTSCTSDDDAVQIPEKKTDIVSIALQTPSLSSLVAALQAADGDLVSLLQTQGPFTVLAPTNAAFSSFLSDNGFKNLEEVPTDVLKQILLNHVISDNVKANDLIKQKQGYTSTNATAVADNKMSLYFNTAEGVRFNGISTVSTADVMASNGVIHIVDAVIGLPTVVDFALADPNFKTLVSALTREDLTFDYITTLKTADKTDPAPFTVFAPTNDAFGNLLKELKVDALKDIAQATLKATLDHHVVAKANVRSNALKDAMTVTTLGGDITANVTGGATLTDSNDRVSNITAVDVQAANGVIHVIDKVVLPNLK